MFTRRQLVTHGTVGAIAAAAMPATAEAAPSAPAPQDNGAEVVRELKVFESVVKSSLASGFQTNSLAFGYVPRLREAFTTFLKGNQKFPDFCEIGIGVFYDLYDWHVKNVQALQVGRTADNHLTIRFMYTTMIVRLEVDAGYIGTPTDRA